MLLDRQLLVREGDVYQPAAAIEDLEVPESLQGLIAARLDGLTSDERRLLQSAAVVGKAFTVPTLAALTGTSEAEIEPLLTGLVRKEILGIQTDPRAPERGQYTFLQDLVRRVAYGTLSRAERRARHLRAAELLEASRAAGDDELLEIVASHLLEAYQAAPDDPDAPAIRERAGRALSRAGHRASSLGASAEAERFFTSAAALADSPREAARLQEGAGQMALQADNLVGAGDHWEQAAAGYLAAAAPRDAARVAVRQAEIDWRTGHREAALERTKDAFSQLKDGPEDADLARAAAQLGRWHALRAEFEAAVEPVERALELSGALELPEILAESLSTKAVMLCWRSRQDEAIVLLRGAFALALDHDLPTTALRAANNLMDVLLRCDRGAEAMALSEQGASLAGKVGDRYYETSFRAAAVRVKFDLAEWDKARQLATALLESPLAAESQFEDCDFALGVLVSIHLGRGELTEAQAITERYRDLEESPLPILRQQLAMAEAKVLAAERRWGESLMAARRALAESAKVVEEGPENTLAFVEAAEAALACGEVAWVKSRLQVMTRLKPGELRPSLKAHVARLDAQIRGAEDDLEGARSGYAVAADGFRQLRQPFPLATTLVEASELLKTAGLTAEAAELTAEALPILERLGAIPWIDRASGENRSKSIA
ncbi:MAG: hypothetical protein ACRENX_11015 [Candidatus Dormibacteria bacterium]